MSKFIKISGSCLLATGLLVSLWQLGLFNAWQGRQMIHAQESSLEALHATDALPVEVYFFIDEKMSSFPWQLYSYPQQTNPQLQSWLKQGQLFVFSKVRSFLNSDQFSWYEGFVVEASKSKDKIPLAKYLNGLKAEPFFLSGRGFWANFNLSQILKQKIDSFNSADFGSFNGSLLEFVDQKRNEFLNEDFSKSGEGVSSQVNIVFLSQGMAQETSVQLVEDKFYEVSGDAIGVKDPLKIKDYEKYVLKKDELLSASLRSLDQKEKPALLIYTADAGDFFFDNDHDTAYRYYLEQGAVPFVVAVNQAYKNLYPHKVALLEEWSKRSQLKSLALAPSLIKALLEVATDIQMAFPNVRAEQEAWKYVDSLTKINFLQELVPQVSFCAHRSNTWAKTLRALNAGGCVELDVVVGEQGDLEIYHPPKSSAGYQLKKALDWMADFPTQLWLDGKDFSNPDRCLLLLERLQTTEQKSLDKIKLLEFGPDLDTANPQIQSCLKGLEALGLPRSYYLPTDLGRQCAESKDFLSIPCSSFNQLINEKINSGLLSDLSFDFRLLPAVERLQKAKTLQWNTWGLSAEAAKGLDLSKFKLVIITTPEDPNTR